MRKNSSNTGLYGPVWEGFRRRKRGSKIRGRRGKSARIGK